jgi:hypothetical protein
MDWASLYPAYAAKDHGQQTDASDEAKLIDEEEQRKPKAMSKGVVSAGYYSLLHQSSQIR